MKLNIKKSNAKIYLKTNNDKVYLGKILPETVQGFRITNLGFRLINTGDLRICQTTI